MVNIVKKNKIIVVLCVTSKSLWPSYKKLYKLLHEDDNFEVKVVLIFYKHYGILPYRLENGLEEYFVEQNINFTVSYNENNQTFLDLKNFKPDYVFFDKPYDECNHELYQVNQLNEFTKTCYIPYGIMIAALQQSQFNLPFHRDVKFIFCESEWHKNLFKKYLNVENSILNDKVWPTGYTRLDLNLEKGLFKQTFFKDKNKLKLIWSPHWTLIPQYGNNIMFSDFYKTHKFFLKLIQDEKDIEIVLKPHPLLWQALVVAKLMTDTEIEFFKESWLSYDRASIYEGGDYWQLFHESDAMINSSVSFMGEYMITGKPILFLRGDNVEFNEFGSELIKVQYAVNADNFDAIKGFIDNVKQDIDPLSKQRIEFTKLYYDQQHSASQKIINILRDKSIK